jgi:trehalose synthase-fused probable maltokinase
MSTSAAFLHLITSWLTEQRWFASKGHQPNLELIGGWQLPGEPDGLRVHLLMDHNSRPPILYQVPVSERTEPLEGADTAFIGRLTDDQGDSRYLYDAPHDPSWAEALLRLIEEGGEATPNGATASGVAFARDAAAPSAVRSSQVLSGEQSNTSIVYTPVQPPAPGDTTQVIVKLFRALHHGDNPDVVLQSALAAAGSAHVPRSIGCVVGEWNDIGREGNRARGHLAFAQEFLAGSEDGWRYALRAAEAGEDFTERARELGVATAEVHSTLAEALGVRAATEDDIGSALSSWQRRLQLAVEEVPAVAEVRELIEKLYSTAANLAWPGLQRIHGDYHLGQVLAAADGRWILLDFEGEPLRPMVERSRPDFTIRDIAGMLRSFDYVAGTHVGDAAVEQWAAMSRRAFLDGYIERSGTDLRSQRALLDAFEVDKAIYEAVYEARNRPDWLPIPTAALRRLALRAEGAAG